MLRAILIDDEQPALDLLEKLLITIGNIEIVGTFTKPGEAISMLLQERMDVVFLDIEMPGLNGIEAAEHIMAIDPGIDVVFVTAYHHYAVEAFELNAIDYVLKPTTVERLRKTIARTMSKQSASKQENAAQTSKSTFICFGRFEWMRNEKAETASPVKWRTSKERELMAYLVHHRNTLITKEKILEDIWPNANLEQVTAFLHTCIYSIRKKIASAGDNYKLEFHNNCYRLEIRGVECDAAGFERVTGGEMVITPDSIGEFEKIANLYKGNYMEEDGFVWAQEAQEKYKSDYIELMRRMSDYYLSVNEFRAAAQCLHSALRQNPYLDDVNERVLLVYAKLGDRLSMIRHYERFTKLLQDELGTLPLKSTVRLFSELYSGNADDESKA
ncbi:response regulator [Paenibacillus sp. CGMCC 1.16610]|uniref:Response regulator n=1 Tax=Paenibacillus anseongense TaxID=2682845 RepID=A0ABW9U1J0_9BACL|nr:MULTISPECIES: response regulator [Paenibacillus]MBA2936983.1 response regulator [Paenibacillus sp. CGMCC 1.16610]MVQ33308.1 response regulator [Paenibacillus anseongense]